MGTETGSGRRMPTTRILLDIVIVAVLSVLVYIVATSFGPGGVLSGLLTAGGEVPAGAIILVLLFIALGLVVVIVHLWQELKKANRDYGGLADHARWTQEKLTLLNNIIRQDILNELTELNREMEHPEKPLNTTNVKTAIGRIRRQIKFTKEYQDIGMVAPYWQNVADAIMRAKVGVNLERVTFEMEIHGVEIHADPLLEKVFFYLIDNSIRHGGSKLSKIRVYQKPADDGLIIVYEDNGDGIPPGKKLLIFPKEFGSRFGYGLFLIKEILAVTRISVREVGVSGMGARFEILVPAGAFRIV